jgi:hypothetical protein
MIPRSRPIAIAFALIAAAQAFQATAGALDWMTKQQISITNGIVAAAAVFLTVYLSGSNVETSNVAVAMRGDVPIAGPATANSVVTGKPVPQDLTVEQVIPEPLPASLT